MPYPSRGIPNRGSQDSVLSSSAGRVGSQTPLGFILVLGGSNTSTGPPTHSTPLYVTDLQGYGDLGASLPQLALPERLVLGCLGVTSGLFYMPSLSARLLRNTQDTFLSPFTFHLSPSPPNPCLFSHVTFISSPAQFKREAPGTSARIPPESPQLDS